jgi:hypothetical protein
MASIKNGKKMSLRSQKDNLAKLMATEDLTIVHKKVPTAYFDVKNRVLCCPTFKDDISSELYDLFMGHEVGHALNTPYEGLHSTIKKNRTLKGYLNVIEDVRIEKAIKHKYQGLRKSFFTAYNELMGRDFFGLKKMKMTIDELSLIDKINLTTKVGHRVNIKLNKEEQPFLDWAERCKTWEEVVECAEAIYEWSKENETRSQQENQTFFVPQDFEEDEEGEEFDEDEGSENSFEDYSDEDSLPDEDDVEGMGKTKDSDEDSENEKEAEGDEESDSEDEEEGQQDQDGMGGREGGKFEGDYDDKDGARESITEHFAHNNEEEYLEEKPIVRTNIDLRKVFKETDIDEIRVSYKEVLEDWRAFFGGQIKSRYNATIKDADIERGLRLAKHTGKKLTDKNKKLIMHMAKEFEMKQTAMRSVKSFQGKTGELDMNMLAKYQIVDDIFKRATYTPDGKNHGITVLLDWSGSIWRQVNDLLEQSIILAEFCRKVNIPYRVYLFSDAYKRVDWTTGKALDSNKDHRDGGYIIEIMSNEMKNREHTEMMSYLGSIWNGQMYSSYKRWDTVVEEWNKWFEGVDHVEDYYDMQSNEKMVPYVYSLGGTPLNNALVVMRKFLPEFAKQYQIEKSILTVITDGYSHSSPLTSMSDEEGKDRTSQEKFLTDDDTDSWNILVERNIIDPYNRRVYPFSIPNRYARYNDFAHTQNLLDWLAKTTGVIVTGYFCIERKGDAYTLLQSIRDAHPDRPWFELDSIWKEARKTGTVIECHGYNKLFMTTTNALSVTGEDGLSDEFDGAKKVRLIAAFKRNQKSKTTSRFLTNEFIKEIA